MFLAASKFTVGNSEFIGVVKEAFRNRPHLVDQAPGFIRMDVVSPLDNPDEIMLMTYWEDEKSFNEWRHSPKFRESHRWIPKGLKLVPKSVVLSRLEYITA